VTSSDSMDRARRAHANAVADIEANRKPGELLHDYVMRHFAAELDAVRLDELGKACDVVRKWNFMACSDKYGLVDEIRALGREVSRDGKA
jgi:hypothetical protein